MSSPLEESVGGCRPPAMTKQVLRDHFHLPLHSVAKQFGMCTTAFKKMCRRLGIAKWPHRQLRGIDKRIAALKAELNYATASDRQQFLSGLSGLEEEKARLAKGVLAGGGGTGESESDAEKEMEIEKLASAATSHARADLSEDDESLDDETQEASTGSEISSGAGGVLISGKELRQHFHLPLHTAAQKFGICTTAFKKLCRRFGIAKWPHRQLRGIDKKIAALKTELNYATGDREGCWKSLQALQDEKNKISRSTASDSESVAVVSLQDVRRAAKKEHPDSSVVGQHQQATSRDPSACESALDLLAAVAGVKAERDRELEEQAKQGERSGPADGSGDDAAQQELDTPPLAPLSPQTPPMMPTVRELMLSCSGKGPANIPPLGDIKAITIPPLALIPPPPMCS